MEVAVVQYSILTFSKSVVGPNWPFTAMPWTEFKV